MGSDVHMREQSGRKTFTVYRCDRCGKLSYGAVQIEPGDQGPPPASANCECYMGPRWVKGTWLPDSLSVQQGPTTEGGA